MPVSAYTTDVCSDSMPWDLWKEGSVLGSCKSTLAATQCGQFVTNLTSVVRLDVMILRG